MILSAGGSFGGGEIATSLLRVKAESLLEKSAIDSESFDEGSSSEKFKAKEIINITSLYFDPNYPKKSEKYIL